MTYPPKVAISHLVNSLKGVSSRLLRKQHGAAISKKLWGDSLWSPRYFAGSCGGAPVSIVRQYIEQQRTISLPVFSMVLHGGASAPEAACRAGVAGIFGFTGAPLRV